MRCYYAVSKVPPTALELDTLDTFDDRTLSSLIATNAKSQAMAIALGDGVDNDNPYNALPLERWRDRTKTGWWTAWLTFGEGPGWLLSIGQAGQGRPHPGQWRLRGTRRLCAVLAVGLDDRDRGEVCQRTDGLGLLPPR
jgi:hypothetical protein